MCGSGSPDTVVSEQKSEPWSGLQPFLTPGYDAAKTEILDNRLEYFPNSTVTPFHGSTQAGLGAIEQRATQGSPLLQAGQDAIQDTASGAFLGQQNPGYQAASDRVSADATNAVNSNFSGSGRFGSPGHAEAIARGVGDAVAPLSFGNYEAERGRQLGAAQMAPGMAQADYADPSMLLQAGAQREGKGSQEIADSMARHDFAQNEPYQRIPAYQGALQGGANFGTQTSTNPQQSSNPWLTGLGIGSTGVGIANGLFGGGADALFPKFW